MMIIKLEFNSHFNVCEPIPPSFLESHIHSSPFFSPRSFCLVSFSLIIYLMLAIPLEFKTLYYEPQKEYTTTADKEGTNAVIKYA